MTTRTMYCDPCGDDKEFSRQQQIKTIKVKGEDITVNAPVWCCSTCGATQPVMDGSKDAIQLAFDEYERRHPKV